MIVILVVVLSLAIRTWLVFHRFRGKVVHLFFPCYFFGFGVLNHVYWFAATVLILAFLSEFGNRFAFGEIFLIFGYYLLPIIYYNPYWTKLKTWMSIANHQSLDDLFCPRFFYGPAWTCRPVSRWMVLLTIVWIAARYFAVQDFLYCLLFYWCVAFRYRRYAQSLVIRQRWQQVILRVIQQYHSRHQHKFWSLTCWLLEHHPTLRQRKQIQRQHSEGGLGLVVFGPQLESIWDFCHWQERKWTFHFCETARHDFHWAYSRQKGQVCFMFLCLRKIIYCGLSVALEFRGRRMEFSVD